MRINKIRGCVYIYTYTHIYTHTYIRLIIAYKKNPNETKNSIDFLVLVYLDYLEIQA